MNSNQVVPRIFGAFFLIAFAAYGTGTALVESITNLTDAFANQQQIIFGSILMSLAHTLVNIGLAVLMLPILIQYNKTITIGYISAAITSTIMLIVGALFLFLLIPLSEEFMKSGSADTSNLQLLFNLIKKGNYYAYQIAMAIWGLGGLMLCYLLYKSRLVPRAFSVWGLIGYTIFISGAILELYGYKVGLLMDIPGGLFEISLSVWLLVKGFNKSKINVYGSFC